MHSRTQPRVFLLRTTCPPIENRVIYSQSQGVSSASAVTASGMPPLVCDHESTTIDANPLITRLRSTSHPPVNRTREPTTTQTRVFSGRFNRSPAATSLQPPPNYASLEHPNRTTRPSASVPTTSTSRL